MSETVLIVGAGLGLSASLARLCFSKKMKVIMASRNIEKLNPQFIATGNVGCITQISNGTKIPILHTVELIDWYTGGPKPEVLRKL